MGPSSIHINHEDWDYEKLNHAAALENEDWKKEGLTFAAGLLSPETEHLVFQTSGTTGTPQQISFTKAQVAYSALNSCRFFQVEKKHTLLLCLPAKYVAGRLMMARAYYTGAKLTWIKPELSPLKNLPAHEDIYFAAFTPAQVSETLQEEITEQKFRSIKKVLIGGGEISDALESRLLTYPQQIFSSYAMTETLTHVAVRRLGEKVYRAVYDDAVFTTDERGCLCISVPSLIKNALVTKDIVELIDPTSFIWKGRWDHVINSGGVKLYPEEIEKKIRESGLLSSENFYITKKKDEKFGEVPVLVIEGAPAPQQIQALTGGVNALLNKLEKIKDIIFLDKFEYTETGKIKRRSF